MYYSQIVCSFILVYWKLDKFVFICFFSRFLNSSKNVNQSLVHKKPVIAKCFIPYYVSYHGTPFPGSQAEQAGQVVDTYGRGGGWQSTLDMKQKRYIFAAKTSFQRRTYFTKKIRHISFVIRTNFRKKRREKTKILFWRLFAMTWREGNEILFFSHRFLRKFVRITNEIWRIFFVK